MTVLLAAGCSPEPPEPPEPVAGASAPAAATAAPTPARVEASPFERARRAQAEQRLYAPAGDNAVELYLALRQTQGDDPRVEGVLRDLFPYVLIATEQAIARGNIAEAERLADLLARIDPEARAVPRIEAAVAALEEDLRTREQLAAARAAAAEAQAEAPARARPAPEVAAAPPPPVPEPVVVVPPPRQEAPPAAAVASASVPAPAPAAAPALVQRVEPRYPAVARARRIEGRVELAYVVRPDGSVEDVQVLSAQPEGIFEREAIGSVRRWRYTPTGRETPMRGMVEFRLNAPS